MDSFELKPERKKVNHKSLLWNLLTVLVLLSTCCMASYFWTVFKDPHSPLNPFPPVVLPTLFYTATPTATIIPLQDTWTPTATNSPVPSRTKAPTWTLLPEQLTLSATPIPNDTPTETETPNETDSYKASPTWTLLPEQITPSVTATP
jgi:hypothetical protein